MITIPLWLFIVMAFISGVTLLILLIITIITIVFSISDTLKDKKLLKEQYKYSDCPDFIEPIEITRNKKEEERKK